MRVPQEMHRRLILARLECVIFETFLDAFWKVFGQAGNNKKHVYLIPKHNFAHFLDHRHILVRITFWIQFSLHFGTTVRFHFGLNLDKILS